MAARTGYLPASQNRRLCRNADPVIALQRVDIKSRPRRAVDFYVPNIPGMDRRRPGPSIDFGIDAFNAEIRQCNEFTPADDWFNLFSFARPFFMAGFGGPSFQLSSQSFESCHLLGFDVAHSVKQDNELTKPKPFPMASDLGTPRLQALPTPMIGVYSKNLVLSSSASAIWATCSCNLSKRCSI